MTARKSYGSAVVPGPISALAVADHASGIRGLQTALNEAGASQVELKTIRPREVPDVLANGSFNLVVLRDAPPDCDALELLGETDNVAAVVVTAHDDCSRIIELFEAGAYDVVSRQQVSCGLLPYVLRRAMGETRSTVAEPGPQFADESLHKALENSPVTVWRQDRNLRYTWVFNPTPPINDPKEFIGRTDEEVFGAEGAKELIALKQQALQSGEPTHDEIRLVANKRITYHNVSIEPQRNDKGQFIGLLCTSVNVTAAHRTEEELRDAHDDLMASNQRLRREMRRRREVGEMLRDQAELLDLAQDAIFVCDSEDRILYWNRGAELTYGYTATEAVGQIAFDLLKTQFPQSFDTVKETLLAAGTFLGELEQTAKDGRQITVASRWTARRSGEEEISFLQINRDVTDQKLIENALRMSETRLTLAQEAGRVGSFDWDMVSNDSVWTRQLELIYGLSPDEGGTDLGFLHMHPDDRMQVSKRLRRVLAERQKVITGDFRIIRSDGQVRCLATRGAVTYDETGKPLRMIGTMVDITERKRSEEAIRKAMAETSRHRAQLEAVFQSVDDGIVVSDMEGNFLLINEAEAQINGYPSPQEMEKDFDFFGEVYELSSADGAPIPFEEWPLSRVLRGEHITDWELRGRRKDTGQEWFFSFAGEPVRDEHGKQILAVVVTRDITERKKAEAVLAERAEALRHLNNDLEELNAKLEEEIRDRKRAEKSLRESEEKFRDLANNISQLAWMADEKGWIFWYNQRWFDYTGTTLTQMEGWGWREVHHPDHVERVTEKFLLHVQRGETWEDTFPVRGKDGEYRWFLSRALPIKDMRGRIVRWFGTSTDVTDLRDAREELEDRADALRVVNNDLEEMNVQLEEEIRDRTRAEQALRQSEERFRAIFEESTMSIVLEDTEGRIIAVNPAMQRLLGWNEEQMRRRGVPGITHPDDASTTMKLLAEIKSGARQRESVEKRYVRNDGGVLWCSTTLFPIRNGQGQIEYVTAMIEDITLRKQAEEDIRNHNKQLELLVVERTAQIQKLERQRLESEKQISVGRMAARIAHEINNPLAGIKNSFLLVKRAIPPDYKHYEFVGLIDKELDRIARIVRQMFELYRPERREPDIFRPGNVIQDVILLLEGNMRAQGVTATLDASKAASSVRVHGDSLKQVLFNILLNAIEASPMGAVVRVEAALHDQMLEVAITDAGGGIPEELQSRIFEPFFTTKADSITGGLGLGLSTSRNLAESMGGTISVESEAGKGTTFRVTLPVETAEDAPAKGLR